MDTKMDLFLKQRLGIFTCNKCNVTAMSNSATFTEIDKEYTKFKKMHMACKWETS